MRPRESNTAAVAARDVRRIAVVMMSLTTGIANGELLAQHDSASRATVTTVVLIGSDAEDQLRLDQLRGTSSTSGWLMRSPSLISKPLSRLNARARDTPLCALRWSVVLPSGDMTWNSHIPFARNDGGTWTGRGATLSATGGARVACGRFRAQFVPALWYAQNRDFPIVASGVPDRSGYASPFHSNGESLADIPIRFGDQPLLVMELGQSVAELDAGPLTVGLGTEAQWWGPGIRNALVMSNHGAGIPGIYFRTRAPVRTFLGAAEARWMVGWLTESVYFDTDGRNDLRSLSGLIIALSPAFDSTLTIGVSRVVYAAIPGIGALPARFLDAVARWGEGVNVRAATFGRAAEQLTNVFARWVFPGSGVEAYADWARVILPNSLRSLLVAPQVSQGFTVGSQWISPTGAAGAAWRAQVEFTMLGQPLVSRAGPAPSFYASPIVPHGYTQRGQVIGAATGPGSSSQWLALDRMTSRGRFGAFVGRTQWEGDEYFRQRTGFAKDAHDVSRFAGVRAARRLRAADVSVEIVNESRLNYLFQNVFDGYGEDRTFDVNNVSLRLSLTPRER